MAEFTVGQRIICEVDLFLNDESIAFKAGNEYRVRKIFKTNVCVNCECCHDLHAEHWLGVDEEGDPSWSRYFRPAHVEATP